MDVSAMRRELEALSSEAVAQIYAALHDLKDAVVHEAALEIIWDRHAVAVAGGNWPTREASIGDPTRTDDGHPPLGTHTLVGSCASGATHRVARQLLWSGADRVFGGWECACGRRSDRSICDSDRYLRIVWRQARPSARVWPVVKVYVESAKAEIPHFQVCRFAAHAEDALHAPNSLGMQCLCGGYLGRHHPGNTSDKLLPMY